ncbi:MAG TPA: hypothetical protein VKE96_25215 [Vicinamibacterales bacterium]|nr:hypothetical protein [Vicinamibacterales bacterium]
MPFIRRAPRAGPALAFALATALAACSRSHFTEASASGARTSTANSPVATLDLEYEMPAVVGAAAHATASSLEAGKTVDLLWGTVTGGWVIEDYYHFRGKKYAEATRSLGQFPVDASGRLNAGFVIPEDYGGVHEVVARIGGTAVAQGAINVSQTFALSPASGPVGTPIELRATGLGWRTMESTWVVNWDNQELGFVSAAGTRGSAVARFRATGPAGDHIVKLYTGWQGLGYLNYEQSPVAALPRPQFAFRTTPGAVRDASYAEPYQPQAIPKSAAKDGARLALTPTQGPVGTRAVLRGDGFAAGTSVQLVWETAVGSRVSDAGFTPQENVIGAITTDASGRFERTVTIPDDLGGLHRLAVHRGDDLVASTQFVIETSIVEIAPRSGPAGTPVSIHLKGVGWTEYDNIYVATYDNAYMGYACGFNSHGDVVINFTATGEPGPHLIDLYPGIYQGPSTEPQQLYRLPQLTYADDHPGNKIPALRFIFDVTPPQRRTPTSTR